MKQEIIEKYEKKLFHCHFKNKDLIIAQWVVWCFKTYKTNYNRDQLYFIYCMIASDVVKWCAHDMQCKWQAYVMFSSNFVWSIDDYMKLELYDIEIYADIDAYSCYIIWIYVEIMTCIIISMLTQFLDVVQNV